MRPCVEEVRAWVTVDGGGAYYPQPEDVENASWMSTAPLASPMSRYPEFASLGSWPVSLGGVAVEVGLTDGSTGIGIAHGGVASAWLIETAFAPLIVGRPAGDIDHLWELMFRATAAFGYGGLALSALSGIDLALWDCVAKTREVPMHEMLAPGSSPAVSLYATGPRPDVYESLGYIGAKISLPHGGGEPCWLRANTEFLREWRERLSRDFFLAVDCFMGLDVASALALVQSTSEFELSWYEEPILPWQILDLSQIRIPGIRLGSGEHNSCLDIERLIDSRAVDIVQPELTWCGGLTPILKLGASARAAGIAVVPHCGGAYSYHFVAAAPTELGAEFLFRDDTGTEARPTFEDLVLGEPLPTGGTVVLDSSPGWGLTLENGDLRRPFENRRL